MSALVCAVKCPQRYREFNSYISEYDVKLRALNIVMLENRRTPPWQRLCTHMHYMVCTFLFLLVFRNSKLQPEDKGVIMFTECPLYEVTLINQNHAI